MSTGPCGQRRLAHGEELAAAYRVDAASWRPPACPTLSASVQATTAGATMGTTWSAKLSLPAGTALVTARGAIQAALDRVVAQMSHWDEDSNLSRFNRSTGAWHCLPEDFFHVMQYALWLAAATDGVYDPALGRLIQAWGFGPGGGDSKPPDTGRVERLRGARGWRELHLDHERRQLWQAGGVSLDLSSIAKGHGVDAAARALDELGLRHYLLDVGGELRTRGKRPDGQPWQVAIEGADVAAEPLVLPLREGALATSGDYRRYYMHDGRRHAHTLDSRTGRPLDNGLASVSVLQRDCMRADALATALIALGLEQGMAWAEARDVPAVFQSRGAGPAWRATAAFRACLAGGRL